MMHRFLLVASALLLVVAVQVNQPAAAQKNAVTFSETIAPIVYQNCVTCHRPGEAAPFSLITYDDVRRRGKLLVTVTQQRIMPPWQATHGYGDFDAHDGLWEMAVKTSGACLQRMALVPRVLEARGLDVTPGMIARLRSAGDADSVAILETILREEVAHVAAGSRWFAWCCARQQLDPPATFLALLLQYAPGAIKGPLNAEARLAAGFTRGELAHLTTLAA